ncbi:MAG: type II toxin-antitoxin system RelE/ParE family toxin [Bacteroidia bacterium]
MSYKVEVSSNFSKEAKRLVKKYRSLKDDIAQLIADLETEPTTGTPLGQNIYKIRLTTTSKGKGKSGGLRVMTLVQVLEKEVILFTIYNKSEKSTLSDKEIRKLIGGL